MEPSAHTNETAHLLQPSEASNPFLIPDDGDSAPIFSASGRIHSFTPDNRRTAAHYMVSSSPVPARSSPATVIPAFSSSPRQSRFAGLLNSGAEDDTAQESVFHECPSRSPNASPYFEDDPEELNDQHERRFFYFAPEVTDSDDPNYVFTESDLPQRPNMLRTGLMMFCPCLNTPNPCGKERRAEYQRAGTTMTVFISAIQVIMFIIAVSIGGVVPSENWLLGPTATTFLKLGAKDVDDIRQNWQVWRFITPVFLHSGFVDVILNLYAQVRLGLYLERKWGWLKFTTIFFVAGTGGILLSCIAQPKTVSVSASAALIGIMGAYLADIGMTWHKMDSWQRKVNLTQCLTVIVMITLEGIGPNFIDSSAHLGGLALGLALAYSIFGREYARTESILANVLPFISWLAILAYFIGGFVLFYTIIPLVPPLTGQ